MSGTPASAVEARIPGAPRRLVPVHREVLADLLTPVRAYPLLCPPGEPGFLLESVEGGERLARYSFIGFRPRPVELGDGNPLDALRAIADTEVEPVAGLPGFIGGAVGYLGYESARHFERLPQPAGPAPDMPESAFLLAENLAVFDHVTRRVRLVALHDPEAEPRSAAESRLDEMEARLSEDSVPREPRPEARAGNQAAEWTANVGRGAYEAMVDAAREYIHAGDAFQVVLSRRLRRPLAARPFDIYRALRAINPSPYMYHLSLGGGRHVIGTSPEVLVKVEGRRVTTRPLAGTRPRTGDAERDAELERELLADPKERAEHVMLVDLGRNDVGRVARPGSVRVDRLMELERYSHVVHISSTVSGELAPGLHPLDALRAAFPAGTVSGAPKIRAMEIVAELEPDRRGAYSGALGYVGFGGNLDMAITLRSVVVAGGEVHVQAGAGIVAASDPATEFMETEAKAGAMIRAVEQAEGMA